VNERPGPWVDPPERKKPLRKRRAERQARKAEFWGARLAVAEEQGPAETSAVRFDRARTALARLPESARTRAFEELGQAIDRVRETHAE
jgi:hypothetical protein